MSSDINQTESTTPDFRTDLAAQLAELVPEAIADGKVDVTKLTELLAEDAGSESERFGLFWPGKRRALKAAQEPTTATLKPCPELSKDWDTTQNVFIEGENLEVLKILQRHYHGKIKMIYIDPPYNTGKDFVYPDNYKEGLKTYLEFTKQVDEGGRKLSTNSESEGRYHSNWLNMMYPRLKLARNLMTADGIIFVSIDDTELANLTRICHEIFGEANYVGTFKWNRTSKAPSLSKLIRNKYEYILCFRRQSASLLRGVDSYNTEAPLFNSGNAVRTVKFPAEAIGFRFADCEFPAGVYGTEKKQVELLDDLHVLNGKNSNCVRIRARFSWSEDTIISRLAEGTEIFFKTPSLGTLYYGMGNRDKAFIAPSDIINSDEVGVKRNTEAFEELRDLFGGKVVFDYSKPVSLLQYLLRMIPDDDFLSLDFFAGSGTLAHALYSLNGLDGGTRRCILVQLPEPTSEESEARDLGLKTIADVARKRLHLAGEKIVAEIAGTIGARGRDLDIGFRAYQLSDSSFAKWRVSSDVEVDALEQHLLDLRDSSATETIADDLLTEILLKQGHSLTEHAKTVDVAGLDVFSVGGGLLLAYLDRRKKPSAEQLREMVDEAGAKVVILEDAFEGDDELKTNLVQLCKTKNIALWTV